MLFWLYRITEHMMCSQNTVDLQNSAATMTFTHKRKGILHEKIKNIDLITVPR